jgi:hypothetical protein
MLEITIFRTQEKTKNLKRILLGQDNTFGPMGSGGYAVRIAPKRRNLLSFQELDTAPAKNFKVGVKKGMIWAGRIAWLIKLILKSSRITFTTEIKRFRTGDDIDKAFARA